MSPGRSLLSTVLGKPGDATEHIISLSEYLAMHLRSTGVPTCVGANLRRPELSSANVSAAIVRIGGEPVLALDLASFITLCNLVEKLIAK